LQEGFTIKRGFFRGGQDKEELAESDIWFHQIWGYGVFTVW
jgi:hypothetical protein